MIFGDSGDDESNDGMFGLPKQKPSTTKKQSRKSKSKSKKSKEKKHRKSTKKARKRDMFGDSDEEEPIAAPKRITQSFVPKPKKKVVKSKEVSGLFGDSSDDDDDMGGGGGLFGDAPVQKKKERVTIS